jgi:hypothetical protein
VDVTPDIEHTATPVAVGIIVRTDRGDRFRSAVDQGGAAMGGTPQSGTFACNVEAVDATAQRLRDVLDELQHFGDRDDAYQGALASQPIRSALNRFYRNSSDQRKKIKDSVDSLAQMLQGLADGVRQVDKALYDSLPDTTTQSQPAHPARVRAS